MPEKASRRDEDAANFGLLGYGTSIRCLLVLRVVALKWIVVVVLLLADCWQGVDHEVGCWRKTTYMYPTLWLEGKTIDSRLRLTAAGRD